MYSHYDNLSDRELIRLAEASDDTLMRALAERLDLRNRDLEDAYLDHNRYTLKEPEDGTHPRRTDG